MLGILRPLRYLITDSFEKENVRTLDAVKKHPEAHPEGIAK
jgi:hypothetical protein